MNEGDIKVMSVSTKLDDDKIIIDSSTFTTLPMKNTPEGENKSEILMNKLINVNQPVKRKTVKFKSKGMVEVILIESHKNFLRTTSDYGSKIEEDSTYCRCQII